MAHGSLILVDKTRGERRGHPFRTLEESNLIWNKIFFFSSKSYKLERFFPFSVTGETAGLFRDLSFTSHMSPPPPPPPLNRELVKIQKHGRGGGSVDVTPGGGGGEGNMKVGSITAVLFLCRTRSWESEGSVSGKRRENKARKREKKKEINKELPVYTIS
jgi:hypothetical protein